MNITFIIGNGFDINIGAKTSYKDFYKSLTPGDIIENDIYRDIIRFKVPEPINSNELIDKYTEMKNGSRWKNGWRTFKSKREIENIEEFEETKKLLESYKYKLESDFDKWSDLEIGIGKYLKKIPYENIEGFFKDYEKLKDDLENYLRSQEENLNSYDNKSNISELEKSLGGFYNFLTEEDKDCISKILNKYNNDGINYRFISFNYTKILDKFVDLANKSEVLKKRYTNGSTFINKFYPVIHIHGTLDEGMIIGVDNENQISNDRIKNKDNMKFFIKPSCNDELRNKKNELCEKIIDSSDIICLFGVSIGETDKKWWNKINDWLTITSKEDRRLIIYSYKLGLKKNDIRQRINIPKQIKNNMKKYLSENKVKNHLGVNNFSQIKITNDPTNFDFSKIDKELDKKKEFDKKVIVALNTDIFKFNLTNIIALSEVSVTGEELTKKD